MPKWSFSSSLSSCAPSNSPALHLVGLVKEEDVDVEKVIHERVARDRGLNDQRKLLACPLRLGLVRIGGRQGYGTGGRFDLLLPTSYFAAVLAITVPRPPIPDSIGFSRRDRGDRG